ncbi:transcription factor E [Aeropyrum pernix K1]|uniref:Transcription factor E n=1 Tax=Aeropyrum pernix (strain ATCC 700893 / DSM 11879 / JCM 9820 / NBRC 100138 / K1) TaxID=272557 RepID=TFE_AERPE|nr:TFIIB-type zinc ribbon-containing protein [Aeropyrum pernix]Q9YAD5.2 RecName: Full=Transcription factor E; Short=TFE; AltName: Full=TFIIE subunit alpha homolog; AltName: Full=Transcription initiation factor TFIIE [Aeropyrum pernix K1]BAA81014.2 transcription factor E [Aeropyrum pernix K1]
MKGKGRNRAVKSLEIYVRKLAQANGIKPEMAAHIFHLIYEETPNGGISDDDLESLTGYKQSDIRRILRLLGDKRIIVSRKGRHPRKEATRYFWRIDSDTINVSLLTLKKKVLEKLVVKEAHDSGNSYYTCPRCGSKYSFDEAFTLDFTCPRCGEVLEEADSREGLERLRRTIDALREEIARDESRIYRS